MTAPRLSALANIPPFPRIATEVLNSLAAESADIRKLALLIEKDPAFASEILRAANSPAFSLRGGIKSVSQAIAQIGFLNLESLTMTVAARSAFSNVFRTPAARQSWEHCLASALIAKQFGPATGVERSEAYTMGLLHDVGRMGLLAAFPEEYGSLLQQTHRCEEDLLAAEEAMFRMDHCAAGALLARNWKLSPGIVEAAASHHRFPADRKANACTLIYVACGLAASLGFGLKFTEPDDIEEVLSAAPPALAARIEAEVRDLSETIESSMAGLT